MFLLLGLAPPSQEAHCHLRRSLTTVAGEAVEWRSDTSLTNDPDAADAPTLLVAARCEAEPERVVAAAQAELQSYPDGNIQCSCELWASAPCPLPIRPPCGYPFENVAQTASNEEDWVKESFRAMREWGVLTQQSVLDAAQVAELRLMVDAAISDAEAALAAHRPEINVGQDAFCFREMASRSRERFDLRLLHSAAGEFVQCNVMQHPKVSALLRQSLGELSELDFEISVVYSRPGADHQGWHADGNHQRGATDAGWAENGWEVELAAAYAICLFLPLIDLNSEVGFTQFWPGSHRHRDLVGFGKVAEVAGANFDAACAAGDAVWYDYRTLHRGMPNRSEDTVRPVVQIIFKRKWYVEKQNYGLEPIAKHL